MFKQSLPGILVRAAECCSRSVEHKQLEYPLQILLSNLRELLREPTAEKAREFCEIYIDDQPKGSITEAFDELAKAAKGRWDGVDAAEWVRAQRAD